MFAPVTECCLTLAPSHSLSSAPSNVPFVPQASSLAMQPSQPATTQLCICLPATSPAGATAAHVEALFFSYTQVRCSVTRLPSLGCPAADGNSIQEVQKAARETLGLVMDSEEPTTQMPIHGSTAATETSPRFSFVGRVQAVCKMMAGMWFSKAAGSVESMPESTAIVTTTVGTEDTQQRFVVTYALESIGAVQSSYSDLRRIGLILDDNPCQEQQQGTPVECMPVIS